MSNWPIDEIVDDEKAYEYLKEMLHPAGLLVRGAMSCLRTRSRMTASGHRL